MAARAAAMMPRARRHLTGGPTPRPPRRRLPWWWLAALSPWALAGCGDPGPGGIDTGIRCDSDPDALVVRGSAHYLRYPVTINGIDYGRPMEQPIRGAIVQILRDGGGIYASCNLDAAGRFALNAPPASGVRLIIKAALGDPAAPQTQVVDNTGGDALYTLYHDLTTADTDVELDLLADSGWDGVRYSGPRAAAPFAILDVIYTAQQRILAVAPASRFPALMTHWSPHNKPVDGDIALGEIGPTSYYRNNHFYLLGAAGLDTDEYDGHVIAHEWAHYFIEKFSRSDSIGGPHALGDLLDPTVAFEEGLSNALSGIFLDDPVVIDSGGPSQSLALVVSDLDADEIHDARTSNGVVLDGYYSESSVEEIVYDLYDAPPADDDPIGLGFGPLFRTLTGDMRSTPAFNSIFNLLYHLKAGQPDLAGAIAALAAAENVPAGDEFQPFASPFYTDLVLNGGEVSVDGRGATLATSERFGPLPAEGDDRIGNKWRNRVFFRFTAPGDDCYHVRIQPRDAGNVFLMTPENLIYDGAAGGAPEALNIAFAAGLHAFAVSGHVPATRFDIGVSRGCVQ